MENSMTILLLTLAVSLSAEAVAQDAVRESELQRQVVEVERQFADAERKMREQEAVDVEVEMRVAESQLEEAARRIGELSSRHLRVYGTGNWTVAQESNERPVLGITIGASSEDGVVAGVEILGVSPGGAAAEAGLHAGDVITTVNKEALSADSGQEANDKLLDFLSGVEQGDTLDVEYLRDGRVLNAVVSPRRMDARVFEFRGPGSDFQFPAPPHAPAAPTGSAFGQFLFMSGSGGWGDMEMVSLSEDLGRYFGTDEGVLVVSAPQDESLKLKDGDVIQSIDGRKPKSVEHTIRILGSYQSGESLELKIMRDKRRQTLKIQIPDNRSSRLERHFSPRVTVNAVRTGSLATNPSIAISTGR